MNSLADKMALHTAKATIHRLTLGILSALLYLAALPAAASAQDSAPSVPAADIPPFLEINHVTPAQYAGAVSFAMESMRLVYGPMAPEQEKKFNATWKPLFQHCSTNVIAYFNKLNPLLGQFLGIRAAMNETITAYDTAQFEAVVATCMQSKPEKAAGAGTNDPPDSVMSALADADLYRQQMLSLQQAMIKVVTAILALGEPPNAAGEAARRRALHEKALRIGRDHGTDTAVKLTWREPPAGWSEDAVWPGNPCHLFIKTDADRHMYLNPEESKLTFHAAEDPGSSDVKVKLVFQPFPKLEDVEDALRGSYDKWPKDDPNRLRLLSDYHNVAGGIYGNENSSGTASHSVESTRLFNYPALKAETRFLKPVDPARQESPYQTYQVLITWYAVDIGMADQGCWLSVRIENFLDDDVLGKFYEEDDRYRWINASSIRQWGQKRCTERWEAMKAIWEREQWYILDSLEISFAPAIPEEEQKRFSQHYGTRITPDAYKATGRPQCQNSGKFICMAESGPVGHASLNTRVGVATQIPRRKPGPGLPPVETGNETVSATSSHSWTEPPKTLVPDQVYTINVACDSVVLTFPSSSIFHPGDINKPTDTIGRTTVKPDFPEPDGPENKNAEASAIYRVPGKFPGDTDNVKKTCRFMVPRDRSRRGDSHIITITAELGYVNSRSFKPLDGPDEARQLFYVWDWMPSRKGGPAGSYSDGAGPRKNPDSKLAAAEKRAKLAQIEFYENEIKCLLYELDGLKKQLAEAKPESRAELARRIMWIEDYIQRAQDHITTLETGNFTRTRTAADEFNLAIMAGQSREMAEKWKAIGGLTRAGHKLIELASPRQRGKFLAFYNSQVNPQTMASGNSEKFKKVIRVLGNQVMGDLELEQANAQLKAIDAAERLERAENLKAVTDAELMILSLGGGNFSTVYTAYMGVTGYIEGGIGSAAKQVLSSYNFATQLASEGMDAYQRGVVNAYEQYAKNPSGGPVDETRAGLISASWGMGKQIAMELTGRYVVGPLIGKILGIPDPPKKKTLKELAQEMQYLKRRAEGMDTVELFREKMACVTGAAKAGATTDEIDRLQKEAEQVYKLIKTDYFAKMRVNELARNGDLILLRQYNAYDHYAMCQLKERFQTRQANTGFKWQEYKLFSNSASAGKAGMDVDLGVVEPPRFLIDAEGKQIPNPARKKWLANLVEDGADWDLRLNEYRDASQRNLEAAFKDVYGYDPARSAGREAFVNFTTTEHPEAYRDLAWLGKKGMKTADIANIQPAWAQQAASVTGYKADSLPEHHPAFGYYGTLQEQCRGTVKDFDTKLTPLLSRSPNEAAKQHMRDLRDVMDRFARNEIGPVEANELLMELTGGRGIAEVIGQYQVMMEGLTRM